MKRFISKIILFLFSSLITMLFFIYLYDLNFNNYKIYQIDSSKNIIILGDSHTACSINDTIYKKAKNLSLSSDAYLYSFIKLRKLLSVNKHIDTVILSCSYHNIAEGGEFRYYRKSFIENKIPIYFFLLNKYEIFDLFKNKPLCTVKSILSIKYNSFLNQNIKLKDIKIGGYYNTSENYITKIKEKLTTHTHIVSNICQKEIDYIKKIETICVNNNTKLILISPPLHSLYIYGNISITNFKDVLKKELPKIDYYNYINYKLEDSCFRDLRHLNYKGAKIFSEYLQKNGFKPLQKDTLSSKR